MEEPITSVVVAPRNDMADAFRKNRDSSARTANDDVDGWQQEGDLFERDQTLSRLLGLFNEAKRPDLKIAAVTGEAGIGKSSLLLELTNRVVENAGSDVWVGYGRALEGSDEPFADAVVDALARERERNPKRVKRLGKRLVDSAPDLLRIIPLAGSILGAAAAAIKTLRDSSISDNRGIAESVNHHYLQLIVMLAREAPVVLLLDDMHWCGESTAARLYYLSQKLLTKDAIGKGVFFVVAYREEDLAQSDVYPFKEFLDRIERYNEINYCPLDRLSKRGIAALIGHEWGAEPNQELLEWVADRSSGNPFFAEQFLGLLEDKGGPVHSGNLVGADPAMLRELSTIPRRVERVLEKRFDGLDKDEVRLLEVASIIGDLFDVELVAAVSERTEDETRQAIRQLCRRASLIKAVELSSGVGNEYAFSHNLVQSYLENRLAKEAPDDFRQLHARCAEALQRRAPWANPQRLARHYHLARDDKLALDACFRSIDALVGMGRLKEALSYADWAKHHAEQLGSTQDRVAALVVMGSLQQEVRLTHEAVRSLEEAATIVQGMTLRDNRLVCEARLHLAKAYRMENRWEEARGALRDAAAIENTSDSHLRATIGLLSAELDLCGDPSSLDRARSTLEQALTVTNDPALKAPVYGHLALALLALGDQEEARAKLQLGMAAAAVVKRPDLEYEQHLYAAHLHVACWSLSDARRSIEAMRAIATRAGLSENDVHRFAGREAALSLRFDDAASSYAIFVHNDRELARDVPQALSWALTHVALQVGELIDMFDHHQAARFAQNLIEQFREARPEIAGDGSVEENLRRLSAHIAEAFEPKQCVEQIALWDFSSAAQCAFNFYMPDLLGFRRRHGFGPTPRNA